MDKQKCKRDFFKVLIFIITVTINFSYTNTNIYKGCSGTYYIKGVAYQSKEIVLKKKKIKIDFGEKTSYIETSNRGEYEIAINWTSPCRSAITYKDWKEACLAINPEFIVLSCQEIELKLENRWQEYGKCSSSNKENVTWRKDLFFW